MKFYFTLGQNHVHQLDDVTWNEDGIIETCLGR